MSISMPDMVMVFKVYFIKIEVRNYIGFCKIPVDEQDIPCHDKVA